MCIFLSFDISFFIANLYKVLDGGWVPLMLGSAMFAVMWTWQRGSGLLSQKPRKDSIPLAVDQDAGALEPGACRARRCF